MSFSVCKTYALGGNNIIKKSELDMLKALECVPTKPAEEYINVLTAIENENPNVMTQTHLPNENQNNKNHKD